MKRTLVELRKKASSAGMRGYSRLSKAELERLLERVVVWRGRAAHPVWFKEAEIALRRYKLPLDELTYEKVRQAIDLWRLDQEE